MYNNHASVADLYTTPEEGNINFGSVLYKNVCPKWLIRK